ncbi:MAG: FtsX-like permease family protein [bacterium]
MKTGNKIIVRRNFEQLGAFISTLLIIAVAVGFFVIIKSVVASYQNRGEEYFQTNALAEYSFFGEGFNESDVSEINNVAGVKDVFARNVFDVKNEDKTFRVISAPQSPQINIPYIYEGEMPKGSAQCLLAKKYADANGLHLGDYLDITIAGQVYKLKITGLMASPEYVYLSKNVAVPFANPKEFGIVMVDNDFFQIIGNPYYNEILLSFNADANQSKTVESVKKAIDSSKIVSETEKKDQLSYSFFKADLKQINLFAYIFPLVFLFITGVIILVIQKRNVIHDRRQIGVMKAMGLYDREIIWIYVKSALLLSTLGIFIGIILSILIGQFIVSMFGSMYELPNYIYQNDFITWIVPALAVLVISTIASFWAVISVTKIVPAEAMHAETPKQGKDIWLQRWRFWDHLSFNSRYAIKSAVRNRGRFWAVVIGMIATISLLSFSFGFKDSLQETVTNGFENTAKYDLSVYLSEVPFETDQSFLGDKGVIDYQKTNLIKTTIKNGSKSKDVTLEISNDIFSMHNIKNLEGNRPDIANGIALPRYIAKLMDVKKGDIVSISTSDKQIDTEVTVSDITDQTANFYALATYDFAQEYLKLDNKSYNTIFIKSNNPSALRDKITESNTSMWVTLRLEDAKSLKNMMMIFDPFIYSLIFFAMVLGVAVLFAIMTINIASREYEFVLLRVMGYSPLQIIVAYIKELLIQIIIALPLGIVLGNLMLMGIGDAFSTDAFEMIGRIYPTSYLYSFLLLISVMVIVTFFAFRKINKLDLVAGLKEREE